MPMYKNLVHGITLSYLIIPISNETDISSLTHFSSHNHNKYSSLPIEQNPPDPQQKETPVPHMPCKKAPRKPAPGPSCKPSQQDEPPIPGPGQSSKSQVPSHEEALTPEPEPQVAPMQSMEEPFAFPATPRSVIIIDDMPISSPHSHNDAQQEFTNLQLTLMIP
ncbi:hypothetical protein O181_014055 [Austropuccinia psidii MF-1]|uniref:Uncharacterized protein n=1 Tax=Austropuccinia psidii MF-1 TaxID=1389203 RepID=A0A9Q3GPJ6_9BASI|nr:hypothetical protein [Austropuccinia psidii MF-1]